MSKGKKGKARMSVKTNGRKPQGGNRPRTIIDLPLSHTIGDEMTEVPSPSGSLFPSGTQPIQQQLTHMRGVIQAQHDKITMLTDRMSEAMSYIGRQAEIVEELEEKVQVLESKTESTPSKSPRGALTEEDMHIYNFLAKMPGVKFSVGALSANLEIEGVAVSRSMARLLAHEKVDRVTGVNLGHINPDDKTGTRTGAWQYFVPAKVMKGLGES